MEGWRPHDGPYPNPRPKGDPSPGKHEMLTGGIDWSSRNGGMKPFEASIGDGSVNRLSNSVWWMVDGAAGARSAVVDS